MPLDQHHNPISGDADAVALYDAALDDLLAYRPAILEHLETFATRHADLPMGHAMTAYLSLSSSDPRDVAAADAAAWTMVELGGNERERMHAEAIDAWRRGDWETASATLDHLLVRWPADLLALMFGHLLDFFLGDALNLRDRVGRSLGAIQTGHPHEGFVLGMHAFGLEETGDYARAEDAGRAALAHHADDVWATHAVAHVLEMQGRADDGIAFMTGTEADWGSGNLFTVHLWWHLGLFLLEHGRIDEVLAIYDRELHHPVSTGVPIELLDASAMLWRLYLDGIDTGNRFDRLADAWATGAVERPWYVFNDVHAVMAMVGAGQLAEARQHVEALEREVTTSSLRTNRDTSSIAGLPAARAVLAFAEGRHDDVVRELAPVRRTLHRFGGSHAQRDAFQRTLVESAIRSGQLELAAALLRERLSTRPTGTFALTRLHRVDAQRSAE